MPFVFGIAGVLLVVAGVRGTTSQLTALIKADFTGTPNYLEWMVAILIVGAVGYIQQLHTISRLFMTAIVLGLLFSNKGFFASLTQGIQSPAVQGNPTVPVPQGFSTALNQSFGVPTPQTTSVQPNDALQLGQSLLQNSGVT